MTPELGTPSPSTMPMVVTHISILLASAAGLLTSVASLVAACAAWRTASKGRRAAEEGRATSARNEGAIALLLNGVSGKVEEH